MACSGSQRSVLRLHDSNHLNCFPSVICLMPIPQISFVVSLTWVFLGRWNNGDFKPAYRWLCVLAIGNPEWLKKRISSDIIQRSSSGVAEIYNTQPGNCTSLVWSFWSIASALSSSSCSLLLVSSHLIEKNPRVRLHQLRPIPQKYLC